MVAPTIALELALGQADVYMLALSPPVVTATVSSSPIGSLRLVSVTLERLHGSASLLACTARRDDVGVVGLLKPLGTVESATGLEDMDAIKHSQTRHVCFRDKQSSHLTGMFVQGGPSRGHPRPPKFQVYLVGDDGALRSIGTRGKDLRQLLLDL